MNNFIIRSMIITLIIFQQNLFFLLHQLFYTEELISKKYNKIFHFKDYLLNSFLLFVYVILFVF